MVLPLLLITVTDTNDVARDFSFNYAYKVVYTVITAIIIKYSVMFFFHLHPYPVYLHYTAPPPPPTPLSLNIFFGGFSVKYCVCAVMFSCTCKQVSNNLDDDYMNVSMIVFFFLLPLFCLFSFCFLWVDVLLLCLCI